MPFSIEKYHFMTTSLLEELPAKEYKLLKEQMTRMEVKKNKVLFRQGYYSKGIYILVKGKVKIFQLSKDGQEQIAYIYSRGEIMGYRPLLCNETHPATAMTLEDCIITFIPQKYFIEVLDRSSTLSRQLLFSLAHEFSVWINTMSILAQQSVRERVALVLLILNEKYKKADEAAVINLSRKNIANYAHTTVETLARVLRQFKDQKIIKTEGRKIILSRVKELEKIAE
jgi:CRP-like cAMP-binding protein